MLLKFSGTLPPWTSRSPFTYNMSEKFYTHTLHDDEIEYDMVREKRFHELRRADLLLRQGKFYFYVDSATLRFTMR